jgi:hypothetical protein
VVGGDGDHADVAIFETEPERLTPEDQQARVYFDLDLLAGGDGAVMPETELITPGYPREHNFVDYDSIAIVALCTRRLLRRADGPRPIP